MFKKRQINVDTTLGQHLQRWNSVGDVDLPLGQRFPLLYDKCPCEDKATWADRLVISEPHPLEILLSVSVINLNRQKLLVLPLVHDDTHRKPPNRSGLDIKKYYVIV